MQPDFLNRISKEDIVPVQSVKKAEDHARSLIEKDKINTESAWTFSADDGNALLGPDNDDWERYALFHLGKDTDQKPETKAYYKYPYGKGSSVYMSALRAIRGRSAQQEHTSVFNVAGRLLALAKQKTENRTMIIVNYKEVEFRNFVPKLEIREDGDEYMFEGYAVTWDSVDSYDSTFKIGAFKKTISERGDRIKILWNHNTDEPIGKIIEIREDKKGLFVRGKLTKGVAKAEDVYKNLQAGVIDTLSFGFTPLQSKKVDGIRQITEVKLYEVSPVTFEANDTAQITDVREQEKRSEGFNETLKERRVRHEGGKICDALWETLWDIWYTDEQETLIPRLDIVLSTFHATYLQWAKEYIAMFWETRKLAMSKNELSTAYINDIEDTIETMSSRTSFTVNELKSLSRGSILPKESRHKLVELPESVRSAHQKERSKVVETLCNELRMSGFSNAEKERFCALLNLREEPKEVSPVAILAQIRNGLKT